MTTDLSAFKGNSLVSSDAFARMMALNKRLGGGAGGMRRISIRGGRFREMINGEQVRVNSSGQLNLVILDSSPIGRTYFEGVYDPENPTAPTCWSADSETPAADVPADQRKATACRNCPMNIKGSGQGNNSRACRFNLRLAVALENNYSDVYQLQLPATSLFGDAKDGKMGMQAYARFMDANGLPVGAVVTTAYFDENSETPKLYFKPARPLEDEDELPQVLELMQHPDVKRATDLTVQVASTESADAPASEGAKTKAKAKAKAEPETEPDAGEDDGSEPAKVARKAETTKPVKVAELVAAVWDD